jgi:hypothetical protein
MDLCGPDDGFIQSEPNRLDGRSVVTLVLPQAGMRAKQRNLRRLRALKGIASSLCCSQ